MPIIKDGGPSFWADQIRGGAPDFGNGATISDGATVAVRNSAAADSHDATAVVADGTTLTGVNLASTVAMVDNSDVISVRNSAGADGHNATAVVTAGAVTGVNLASTTIMLDNGDTFSVADVAGTIGTATAVVSSGTLAGTTLPGTDKIIKSTVQVPCPAPTGTRTTGYVFTIVNGSITAAVGY